MYCPDITTISHLPTSLSLKMVLLKFNLTISGPLSRVYLPMFLVIDVASEAVQVMVAWGLLSNPVPHVRLGIEGHHKGRRICNNN